MIAALGTDSDGNVAAALGLPRYLVKAKRRQLGIPPHNPPPHEPSSAFVWSEAAKALLGAMSDARVAATLGISKQRVFAARRRFRVPPYQPRPPRIRWTRAILALLGTITDRELAQRFGISQGRVRMKRGELGIPSLVPSRPPVRNPELAELLRRHSTRALRQRVRMTKRTINRLRRELGIPPPAGYGADLVARLGRATDQAVADATGVPRSTVGRLRRALGIEPIDRRRKHRWQAVPLDPPAGAGATLPTTGNVAGADRS